MRNAQRLPRVHPPAYFFSCSSPNFSGTWCPREEIETLLTALPPHVLLVLDEAYFELPAEWVADAPGLVLGRLVCQLVNEAAFAVVAGATSFYLISQAQFVACHQFTFLERVDMLKYAKEGAVFLLNSLYGPDEVWDQLPVEVQKDIIEKKLKFYVINGYEVAEKTGMGGRMNTIMQTAFFAISGILPREDAIAEIKHSIEKSFGKRGEAVVQALVAQRKTFVQWGDAERQPD